MIRDYEIVLHPETLNKVWSYLSNLQNGATPGVNLRSVLGALDVRTLDAVALLSCLLQTKIPQIFAESAIYGDGSDWNSFELSILGDISISVPVTVYDNALHRSPEVHPSPLSATLLYTPGALLRNGRGQIPADWGEVVVGNDIDQAALDRLYERRLLPVFLHANQLSMKEGRRAVITVPGLGCGQFAGPFSGRLGEMLKVSIGRLLENHHRELPYIKAIYYDPYNECRNTRLEYGHISYLVRPLLCGNEDRPQLCMPEKYGDSHDDFSDLRLFSVVAWDHVSWPGNDFFIGSRATDDGVKAAATSSMYSLTGIEGQYDPQTYHYSPPSRYVNWADVIKTENLQIQTTGRISVLPDYI